VSTEPTLPQPHSTLSVPELLAGTPEDVAWVVRTPPPLKFQHRYRTHILLFVLTVFTATYRELVYYPPLFVLSWWQTGVWHNPLEPLAWRFFVAGLWYSVPLLTILAAHEFGHYVACRIYNVDATLPYFLPAPLPLSGTFGAVIRIREPFPSKAALFDIAVAGPIAGFLALIPFLLLSMRWSMIGPLPPPGAGYWMGEPLLWKAVAHFHFGTIPTGLEVYMPPTGEAAWMGMLMTSLNLLPFGQLDGGHIMYAATGRRAQWFSAATLGVVLLLTVRSASWFVTAALMVAMALIFGFRHPYVYDEHEPLDGKRRVIAVCALAIFILCFMPVPISVTGP
jgi:hypothetical protein